MPYSLLIIVSCDVPSFSKYIVHWVLIFEPTTTLHKILPLRKVDYYNYAYGTIGIQIWRFFGILDRSVG